MSLASVLETRRTAWSLLRQCLRILSQWRARARARRALRIMCDAGVIDDHLLRDIGISRSQLYFSAWKRFWEA
jgi:uncharacterized protein YjiS (DUF1127 family)